VSEKLKKLFSPESVAVIGASDGFDKLGYHVMKSLILGKYGGAVYPVNPKAEKVWGLKAYVSLKAIPGEVDLAVIVVPAPLVAGTLHECGQKRVKGVVLITAGFKEIEDSQGTVLEQEIRDVAAMYDLPIIGPNTFGFANIASGINASFTPEFSMLDKGGVTLISQSGGMCHLCGFLAMEERMGMSNLMSLGNRVNVDFPEALRFFVEEDENTRVVALYIEGLDEPKKMLETARSLGGKKPIIAYKAGKSEKGDSASKFHTGSLAGDYQVWKGALRQAGILEVTSAEELVDTAKALDVCAPLEGNRIAVLSGQAGPGMVAADMLEDIGLRLARFAPETQEKINGMLPPIAIRTNPVDMGPSWYNPGNMLNILGAVLDDEETDGVLFIAMYASANVELMKAMEEIMDGMEAFKKPVIACFTAPPGIWDESIKKMDRKKGVAILHTPERAARAMGSLLKMGALMKR
jgi:acyl-CoA synthetase (NDP forming)